MTATPRTFDFTGPEPLFSLPVSGISAYKGPEVLNLPTPEWMIEGCVELGGLTIIYGKPGRGKSLIAMDWACTLAAGETKWMGRDIRVREPKVLYILGEGSTGLRKRVGAWMIHRGLDPNREEEWPDVTWLNGPASLWHDPAGQRTEDQAFLIAHVEEEQYDVVFVDTMARTFGGGNENMQPDMNVYLDTLGAFQASGAAVVVVHHSNKGEEEMRGSTVLEGGADIILQMKATVEDGNIRNAEMSVYKAKDGGGESTKMHFEAVDYEVPLGIMGNGEIYYRTSPFLMKAAPKNQDDILRERILEAVEDGEYTKSAIQNAVTGNKNDIGRLVNDMLEEGILKGRNRGEKLSVVRKDAVERL